MAIDVVSCFEVKPRRCRNDNDDDDDAASRKRIPTRKAFRLCVNAADRRRLFDPCRWPDSVTIYGWFFKAANPDDRQQTTVDKRQRLAETAAVDATLTADQSQVDVAVSSDDDTILTETTATTSANPHAQDG